MFLPTPEERINAGFKALLEQLRAPQDVEGAQRRAERAAAARVEAKDRVRREYAEIGMEPPSELALSITARRAMGMRLDPVSHETTEAAE